MENLSNKDIFLAGHSLGGIMARESAKKMDLAGLMLFASYLPKSDIAGKDFVSSFPIPVLTLGGELDGLTGINYIAREFMEASKAKLKLSNIYKKPVILLEGVNHSQFADGYGAKGI